MTNNKKLIIIASAILIIAVGTFFIIKSKNDSAFYNDKWSKTGDTPVSSEAPHLYSEGEEGESFPPCRSIAQKALVFSEPNDNAKVVGFRTFGATIYVKDYDKLSETNNDFVGVYNQKPNDANANPDGYMHANTLISSYGFDDYNKFFSLAAFAAVPAKFKKIIMDNKTYENHSYYPTQDVNRSKFCVCYGDFNADNEIDMAIVLDNAENQTSKFMILCTNTSNKLPYLAYESGYDEYVKIRSVKKGTAVKEQQDEERESAVESASENETEAQPAAEPSIKTLKLDGVAIRNELLNQVILYDLDNNKFRVSSVID